MPADHIEDQAVASMRIVYNAMGLQSSHGLFGLIRDIAALETFRPLNIADPLNKIIRFFETTAARVADPYAAFRHMTSDPLAGMRSDASRLRERHSDPDQERLRTIMNRLAIGAEDLSVLESKPHPVDTPLDKENRTIEPEARQAMGESAARQEALEKKKTWLYEAVRAQLVRSFLDPSASSWPLDLRNGLNWAGQTLEGGRAIEASVRDVSSTLHDLGSLLSAGQTAREAVRIVLACRPPTADPAAPSP